MEEESGLYTQAQFEREATKMIQISESKSETTLKGAILMIAILLLAAATGFGQQQINLSAGPATAAMPDGTVVPMWSYTCGAAVTGSTATCAP